MALTLPNTLRKVDNLDVFLNPQGYISIVEKCFDIWGILNVVSIKSVEPRNNSFDINHIIRFGSKLLPLGFKKVFLFLIIII